MVAIIGLALVALLLIVLLLVRGTARWSTAARRPPRGDTPPENPRATGLN